MKEGCVGKGLSDLSNHDVSAQTVDPGNASMQGASVCARARARADVATWSSPGVGKRGMETERSGQGRQTGRQADKQCSLTPIEARIRVVASIKAPSRRLRLSLSRSLYHHPFPIFRSRIQVGSEGDRTLLATAFVQRPSSTDDANKSNRHEDRSSSYSRRIPFVVASRHEQPPQQAPSHRSYTSTTTRRSDIWPGSQ